MNLTTTSSYRYRVKILLIQLAALLCQPMSATAHVTHELGASSEVQERPLQELIPRLRAMRERRNQNLIYVTIAQARVYGEGSGYHPYCSPQIRAINTSYKTVEDLIVGIRYMTSDNKDVGSTITRFSWVKIGNDETHYFYNTIDADYCHGLRGEMEIVRCMYENGKDCTDDVRTMDYGAVPMKIVGKGKEKK